MSKRITIPDLLPDTDYALRVRIKNGDAVSDWSPVVNFTTITDDVLPYAPDDVTWVASGDSFHAEWSTVTTNVNGDIIPITRYEVSINNEVHILSVPQVLDGLVTFDLTFEQNRALLGIDPSVILKVRSVDNKELKSAWSTPLTATNAAPGPVTAVDAVGGTGSIDVSWIAPADTDLVRYEAYIGGVKIWQGSATRFTFNTVTYSPQTITIYAVDKFNQSSTGASDSATATTPFTYDTTPPANPSWTSATLTNNTNGIGAIASLVWTQPATTDLARFEIRYRKSGDTTWYSAGFADAAATTMTVEVPLAYNAYEFGIRAIDNYSNASAWVTTTASAVANTAPSNVAGLTASAGANSISYSWTPVTDGDLKNYEVTFSTSATFAGGNTTYYTGTAAALSVAGLTAGTPYYARVRAVDQGGLTSASWSSTVSATTGNFPLSDGVVPGTPTAPTVTGNTGILTVRWAPVTLNASGGTQADPVTYEVHLSTSTGFTPGPGTKVTEVSGTEAFIDATVAGAALTPGTTYYVKLIAKDRDGAQATASGQGSNAMYLTVKSSYDEYALAASETVAPVGGWSTTPPTRTPGNFIWARPVTTFSDNSTTTGAAYLVTGNTGSTGSAGTPAAYIYLTATSQVLSSPAGGGATTPATSTVTGTAVNTTITAWTYSVDGAAFSASVPTGVSRTGNVVTITGSTMVAKTIAVRMADAGGVADTLTVAKVSDGATGGTGGTGAPGANGYTVLLSNESQTFAGTTNTAVAGSAATQVIAYQGAVLQNATIGTIPALPTGMTAAITNNGTTTATVTFTVTTSLTQQAGTVAIPITVNGVSFTQVFSWSVAYTGATGATGTPGANASTVDLTANTQVLAVPAGGGATTPTTATVTGTPTNTTISTWDYSVDGAAFSGTVPTGVSRTGNVVTITGGTMTAKTIAVRATGASGVADTLTVAKVSDGATGATGGTGPTGSSGYTVLLTDEAHVFAGAVSNALAGSAAVQVIAYKGAVAQNATIGTIPALPTGMTSNITNNGTTTATVTFTVTTSLTQQNGTVAIPITVDGVSFTQVFTWSVAYQGTAGATGPTGGTGPTGPTGTGVSSVTTYYYQQAPGSAPSVPVASPPPGPWTATEPGYAPNTELYTVQRVVYSNGTFAYGTVSKDSAYTASTTAITSANGKNTVVYSTSNASGSSYITNDTWYKMDVLGATGKIIAQWNYNGGWQPTTLRHEVIASVDAGVVLAGSTFTNNLNVKSAFTLGDGSTTGEIKSYNYSAGTAGWRIGAGASGTLLEINQGTIDARTFKANSSIITNMYVGVGGSIQTTVFNSTTGFQINNSGITMNDANSTVKADAIKTGTLGASSGQAIQVANGSSLVFNSGHLRSNTYVNGSAVQLTSYSPGTAVSGWYLGSDGLHIVQGKVHAEAFSGGSFTGGAISIASGGSITFAGTGNITATGFVLNSAGLTLSGGASITGAASIDGGALKIGTITSTQTGKVWDTSLNVDPVTGIPAGGYKTDPDGNKAFAINLAGAATFADAVVRGQLIVGNTSTPDVTKQGYAASATYVPGSAGWIMRADGTVEFRAVAIGSLSGTAIEHNTLAAEAITGGTISAGISLAGAFETASSPVNFVVSTTNGSATITTSAGAFYPDDVGVTITGTNIPANTIIGAYISATSVSLINSLTLAAANATATGTPTATVFRGRKVRISGLDGVRLYNAAGGVSVELPTDPSRPARFSGSLFATDVHIADQFRLYGINNSLGSGAILQLNPGTYVPPAPAINYDWNQGHLYNAYGSEYNPSTDSYVNAPTGFKYDPVSGKYYFVFSFFGTNMVGFTQNGVVNTHYDQTYGSIKMSPAFLWGDNDIAMGWAQDGTYFHFLTYNNLPGAGTRFYRQSITRTGINRVGGPIAGDAYGTSNSWYGETNDGAWGGYPTIAIYGGNIYTAKINSSGQLWVYKHPGWNTSTYTHKSNVVSGLSGSVVSMEVGQFDFGTGSTYAVITWQNNVGASVHIVLRDNGSAFVDDTFSWWSPANKPPLGVAYVGTSTNDVNGYFKTVTSDGYTYDHTKLAHTNTAATISANLAYRYATGSSGTSKLGTQGPNSSVALLTVRRSRLTVALPSGVTIPNTGGTSPNAITVYAGTSTLWKFPEPATGATFLTITALRTSDDATGASGGALATGTASQITSGTGGLVINGTGDITARHITATGSGWNGIPYNANYQNFAATVYQLGQYKRVGNIVYLRGLVTRNTATAPAGSSVGTLPADCRPGVNSLRIFNAHLTGGVCRVDVDSNGAIIHQTALTVGGYLSLDGIFFEIP